VNILRFVTFPFHRFTFKNTNCTFTVSDVTLNEVSVILSPITELQQVATPFAMLQLGDWLVLLLVFYSAQLESHVHIVQVQYRYFKVNRWLLLKVYYSVVNNCYSFALCILQCTRFTSINSYYSVYPEMRATSRAAALT
jgi:hypothetical protein